MRKGLRKIPEMPAINTQFLRVRDPNDWRIPKRPGEQSSLRGTAARGTAALLTPLRQLFLVFVGCSFSTLLADASRADQFRERVQPAVRLFGHRIFLSQNASPEPDAGFFLPLPPCLPHSDKRALYLTTVACPPPDAMHRGQMSRARECLEQFGIRDLTANTNGSETS